MLKSKSPNGTRLTYYIGEGIAKSSASHSKPKKPVERLSMLSKIFISEPKFAREIAHDQKKIEFWFPIILATYGL